MRLFDFIDMVIVVLGIPVSFSFCNKLNSSLLKFLV